MGREMKYFPEDVEGKQFGRLKALKVFKDPKDKYYWRHVVCLCSCGNVSKPRLQDLIRGKTISCGCKRNEELEKGRKYDRNR